MHSQQADRGCSIPLDKQLSVWGTALWQMATWQGHPALLGLPLGSGVWGQQGHPAVLMLTAHWASPPPRPSCRNHTFSHAYSHRTVRAAEKATRAEQVFTHEGQVCFPGARRLLSPQCGPLGPRLGHLCCHPVSSYTPGSIKPSFKMLLGVVSPNKHAGMCAWETRTAFWGNKRYFSPFPNSPISSSLTDS